MSSSSSSYAMRAYGTYDSAAPSMPYQHRAPVPRYSGPSTSSGQQHYYGAYCRDCPPSISRHVEPEYPLLRPEESCPQSAEFIKSLMDAACHNHLKIVCELIKSGAVSVDAQDKHLNTALLYASMNGHMNVVRKLIEYGCNVNYIHPHTLDTALHLAAQCGHTRSVELLLKTGQANARQTNSKGKTPFDLARDFGHGNNKVMRRLFTEAGVIGNRGGAHRRKNGAEYEDSDDDSEAPSVVSGYTGCGRTRAASMNEECDSAIKNGAEESKVNTLLPSMELLSVFRSTGIYRPLSSGRGFTLLAPSGDAPTMIDAARHCLEVPPGEWLLLKSKLADIVSNLENDLLLENLKIYQKVMNLDVNGSTLGLAKKSPTHSSNFGNSGNMPDHTSKRAKRTGPRGGNCDGPGTAPVMDPIQEMAAYLDWKEWNIEQIEQMISAIEQLATTTAVVNY